MEETQEFWLTSPRFLKQVGESEPQYINASPTAPVKVVLPAKIERAAKDKDTGKVVKKVIDHPEDEHLVRAAAVAPPEKPKNAVSPNQPQKGKAAGAQPVAASDGGRAADK